MNEINRILNNRIAKSLDHPVKLTALEYLKEALKTERYEDCSPILAVARDFGADEFEIEAVIERYADLAGNAGTKQLKA